MTPERRHAKHAEVRRAESAGEVADSLSVRMALLARVDARELTFEQMHAELKAIQRGAKKAGKITRAQAWRHFPSIPNSSQSVAR